jgi:protein-ribulosamine 3-kinase
MKLDPAVLKLLQLDVDSASVSAGGGGCSSASTSKIVSQLSNGEKKTFFMKTGSGRSAETMFEGPAPLLHAKD